MKVFNAIQMVILLMASPTILTLLWNASFSGARALFWTVGVGTLALAIWIMICILDSWE